MSGLLVPGRFKLGMESTMSGKETLPPPKVDSRLDGYEGPASSFEKLVDSRMFITFARLMMILATLIGLPIAGVMGNRVLATMDKSVDKLEGLFVNQKLLQEQVRTGFDRSTEQMKRIEGDVQDHESRIRVLERLPPALIPVQPMNPVEQDQRSRGSGRR